MRNFNDFGYDVNASALPQFVTITPHMMNDCHDTTIEFCGDFVEYFVLPLLKNKKVNDGKTLILLTFDENETETEANQIFSILLGDVIPDHLKGTTDNTFVTHYSAISTVEANWDLKSLGRQDTNPYSFLKISCFYEKLIASLT